MGSRAAVLVVSAYALVASGCGLAHQTCSVAPCDVPLADGAVRDAGQDASMRDAAHAVDAARPIPDDAAAHDAPMHDATTDDAAPDAGPDAGPSEVAPRPIAPLSTSTVTTRRPTLRWSLPPGADGAHVDVCADRACAVPIESADASGNHYRVMADLPATVVFWRLFAHTADGPGTVASPTWQFVVPSRSAPVDSSWGTTLDFNGDGYADVIVGASDAQEVHVYPGGPTGIASLPIETLTGTSPGGFPTGFGSAIASAGDVDGDGFGDVLLGAYYSRSAVLYYGGASGISDAHVTILHDTTLDSAFGVAVASAGDVNGDGYADILVGGGVRVTAVFFGRAGGLATTPSQYLVGNGHAVAGAGDINADGFGDAVVSGEMSDVAGPVHLYVGSATGLRPWSLPLDAGGWESFGYGTALAGIGDANGDGYSDFAVSAPTSPGHVLVYAGSATGPFVTAAVVLTGSDSMQLGSSLAGGSDLNGDGYSDLAANMATYGPDTTGALVFYGGPSGLDASGATTITLAASLRGEPPIAAAGDVDGDGRAELLLTRVVSLTDSLVEVFIGTDAGITTTPSMELASPDRSGTRFGSALAALERWMFPIRTRQSDSLWPPPWSS